MFFISKPQQKFITDIVVTTPQKFKKLVHGFDEVAQFPNYKITDGVSSLKPKVTYNANTCAILAMSNGQETYLGHYAPEIRKADFADKLDYIIKQFQDKTGKLSAIVTGGHDFHNTSKVFKSKESYEQLADIGNILDKNNVDNLTMIAAKRNPLFKEHLAVSKDKFILTQDNNKITTPLDFKTNPTKEELEAILDKNYSILEIDEGHTINFEV